MGIRIADGRPFLKLILVFSPVKPRMKIPDYTWTVGSVRKLRS